MLSGLCSEIAKKWQRERKDEQQHHHNAKHRIRPNTRFPAAQRFTIDPHAALGAYVRGRMNRCATIRAEGFERGLLRVLRFGGFVKLIFVSVPWHLP